MLPSSAAVKILNPLRRNVQLSSVWEDETTGPLSPYSVRSYSMPPCRATLNCRVVSMVPSSYNLIGKLEPMLSSPVAPADASPMLAVACVSVDVPVPVKFSGDGVGEVLLYR